MIQDLHRIYKRSWMEDRKTVVLIVAASIASSTVVLCAALGITGYGVAIVAGILAGVMGLTQIKQHATYNESRNAMLLFAVNVSVTILYLTMV